MRSVAGLEHAPFPKVIRFATPRPIVIARLEHAPFPKVIRYVRIEKPF